MPRSKPLSALTAAAVIPLAALVVAGCGGNSNNDSTAAAAPPKTPGGKAATISVENDAGLGNVLVTSQGRTLYLFQKDSGTRSTCVGQCATAWPPLRVSHKPTVAGGAKASMVSTTKRSDGSPEVTYNGHPLYLFDGDSQPGEANGQGVTAFGGRWYALSPAGDQVTGTPSNSSGGGGSGY